MILYTADIHFGHSNVIKFDNRPFANREEMDNEIICRWNKRVSSEDHVYILGDFCYRSDKAPDYYLKKLKGHKHLIIGNHDSELMQNEVAVSLLDSIEQIMVIKDEDKKICLCHYPMAEWYGYYKGYYHIYGHIHGRKNEAYDFFREKDHALNAGCMLNYYVPVSFNELLINNQIFKQQD